jgi:hypothetical protein
MKEVQYKRTAIALGILCLVLLACFGVVFWNYGLQKTEVALAEEQTRIFEAMRVKAMEGDSVVAVECLEYVVHYYPSGTKQRIGSRLDRVVDRNRALTEQAIITSLRHKTHEDLGTNSALWIQKYGK